MTTAADIMETVYIETSQERINAIRDIERLQITSDCKYLAERIIAQSPLTDNAQDDSLHIAIASYHSIDFLLTWNFRHLANAHIMPKVGSVVIASGYQFPQICTPEELMGG